MDLFNQAFSSGILCSNFRLASAQHLTFICFMTRSLPKANAAYCEKNVLSLGLLLSQLSPTHLRRNVQLNFYFIISSIVLVDC